MTSGSTSLESLSAIERPYDDTIAAKMAELVSGSMKPLFIASSVHKPLNPGIRIRESSHNLLTIPLFCAII